MHRKKHITIQLKTMKNKTENSANVLEMVKKMNKSN